MRLPENPWQGLGAKPLPPKQIQRILAGEPIWDAR